MHTLSGSDGTFLNYCGQQEVLFQAHLELQRAAVAALGGHTGKLGQGTSLGTTDKQSISSTTNTQRPFVPKLGNRAGVRHSTIKVEAQRLPRKSFFRTAPKV